MEKNKNFEVEEEVIFSGENCEYLHKASSRFYPVEGSKGIIKEIDNEYHEEEPFYVFWPSINASSWCNKDEIIPACNRISIKIKTNKGERIEYFLIPKDEEIEEVNFKIDRRK